jgi:hypothetical protein
MTKYVKCIGRGFVSITQGKIYEVVKFTPNDDGHRGGGIYEVITDTKGKYTYYAENFEPVQCPCDIKTCIKHRKSL